MKKRLGLLVLVLMMGLILAGCGKTADTSSKSPAQTKTVTQDSGKTTPTTPETPAPTATQTPTETPASTAAQTPAETPAATGAQKTPAATAASTAASTQTKTPTVTPTPDPTPTVTPTTDSTPTPTIATPPAAKPKELIISAAASLKNAMTDITAAYAKKAPNIKLTFNFGSSGALQTQIEQGAPADIFFSAGKTQVDNLEKKGLLLQGTRVDLLLNDLVLVVSKDNTTIKNFDDLSKATWIAIGTPESVPAGQYAKETLVSLKMWDLLQPKYVQAKDVTAVLTYVENGNADAGFVYRSDSLSSTKVKVVATAPASSHSKILYPAAVVKDSGNPKDAKAFLDYLKTSEAQAIFIKYGFKSGL